MILIAGLILLCIPSLALAATDATPPKADVRPVRLEKHGHIRSDPYFWLRERENPEVIAYLEAENAYTEEMMQPMQGLQSSLIAEIRSRMKEEDASAPYKNGDYYYYHRYVEDGEYKIYARKKDSVGSVLEN